MTSKEKSIRSASPGQGVLRPSSIESRHATSSFRRPRFARYSALSVNTWGQLCPRDLDIPSFPSFRVPTNEGKHCIPNHTCCKFPQAAE
ncbi:hypothetical protein E2C01_006323 [Portunus trituberculatus]|uniref:Uncharacterized protein n=1 Tax=Portunus trituberculatus TaxID=210409 RepID=A0A5B7CWV4_PORTR|nr:hypothetical protein [Portunus trituberculatus]